MPLTIRKASSQDLSILVEFNQSMAMETEKKPLDTEVLTQGVNALLHDSSKGFYLVAEDSQDITGSLMVTFEWSDWRNGNFWWVQSVYVCPKHRRKGIYSSLYARVKEMAKKDGHVSGIRLYVEKDNVTAQQTYQHLDMEQSHYLMYESI